MQPIRAFNSWSLFKKTLVSSGAVVAAVVAIWQGVLPVYSWFEPASLALEQHTEIIEIALTGRTEIVASMNDRSLRSVREQIADLEDLIIETKYRVDITAQQKEALISSYTRKITRLKQIEACLMRGLLDCF